MITDYRIEELEHYVQVIVDGTYSDDLILENMIHIWREAAHRCKETKKHSVLAYWNLTGHVSFFVGMQASTYPDRLFDWDRSLKIAIIYQEQSKEANEMYQLFETMSSNRGFRFKAFAPNEKRKAVQWLNKGGELSTN